jgi:two-component system KDP operon response regulator KdpE
MTAKSPLLLIVEDELPLRKFLVTTLTDAGYRIEEAGTGQSALQRASQSPPDLVLLDLGLPDMDGQDVLRQLRQWLKAPIIILSARNQEQQKITALDLGADDYLTKPFSTGELLARIRAALRHATHVGNSAGSTAFEFGDLKVDLLGRRVLVRGREVHLTPNEYKLLAALIRYPGKILTHRQLLSEVWGPHQVKETHYLRVFMASLRRKLEDDPARPRYLLTEQGVGYRLASD